MTPLRAVGVAIIAAGVTAVVLEAPLAAQQAVEPVILSPEPGEQVPQGSVGIAVSFIDPDLRLDPSSIRLLVGGTDVTNQATISAELVRWRPLQPLPRGPQRVALTASDRNGVELSPVAWTFHVIDALPGTVTPDQAAASGGVPSWARVQGSVIFENSTASVSGPGSEFRRDENFLPRLWVNANGYLTSGIRYGARVHVSGYETSTAQPVNRYSLNLRHDIFNVTVGDASPYMHDLILNGRRVRGVQGQLQAGFFGLNVVRGQDRRAVEGTLDPDDPTVVSRSGTFARDITAIRPTFGTGRLFQLGLTVMQARDDVSSIPELRTDPAADESTQSANPLPKDNLVAGLDLTTRLLDGRVTLQYQGAGSLLANDISGGPLELDDLNDLLDDLGQEPVEIDPADYEDFFIINASLTPLDMRGLTNLAHQARATVQVGAHFLSGEYRSVGSSYYSLGNPSLQRDRVGFRVQDAFSLLDRSLAMTVGVDRDEDNVDGLKSATATTSEIFIDASWQTAPDRIGVNAALRLGSRSSDAAPGDDGALDETSRTFALGTVYPVELIEGYRTRVNANWSLLTRDDPENPAVGSDNHYFLVGFSGESLDRRQEFSVAYGLNRSVLTALDGVHSDFHRLATTGRRLVAPRWTALADVTLTLARSSDEAIDQDVGFVYNRIELMGGAEWEWTPSAFVTLEAGVVNYADDRFPASDTRELLTRIRLSRPF